MVELQAISSRLERGEIDGAVYLLELMRHVADRIGCSRASLRLLVDEGGEPLLRTLASSDDTEPRVDVRLAGSTYLDRLKRLGVVAIDDLRSDARIDGELRTRAMRANVASVLDVVCAMNGTVCGTFTCEQIGAPQAWTPRKVQALRSIASRACLSLMRLLHDAGDTAPAGLGPGHLSQHLATMPAPLDRITSRGAPSVRTRPLQFRPEPERGVSLHVEDR